nr:hypothetical protein [Borreliella turdi]
MKIIYKIFGYEMLIAKIIALEPTEEFEKKYEAKSLKLNFERSNIDFEKFEKYRIGFPKISLKLMENLNTLIHIILGFLTIP